TTFWTRRAQDGTATKFQPQRLVVMLAVLGLSVPFAIVADRAGTNAVHGLHCSRDRRLWSSAPMLAEPAVPLETIASRIANPALTSGSRNLYRIGPSALFNRHNTRAVQRDAGKLVDGLLVQRS